MDIYITGMTYDGQDDLMTPATNLTLAKNVILDHCKTQADVPPSRLTWEKEKPEGPIQRWRTEHEDMTFVIERRAVLTPATKTPGTGKKTRDHPELSGTG